MKQNQSKVAIAKAKATLFIKIYGTTFLVGCVLIYKTLTLPKTTLMITLNIVKRESIGNHSDRKNKKFLPKRNSE